MGTAARRQAPETAGSSAGTGSALPAPSLPLEVIDWLIELAGGGSIEVTPFPHHRPHWSVDVIGASATTRWFVRASRDAGSVLAPVYNLEREAGVIRSLTALGVPTPAVRGFHAGKQLLVLDRVPGRSDFANLSDPGERQRVAEQFIGILAALHGKAPADFPPLPSMPIPSTPQEHALGELEVAERLYDAATLPPEPAISLGRRWLRQHAPATVDHTCFVQGDTGPGNFVFHGRELWLLDMELAHFGDPMEDLAAICIRDMVSPFVDLRWLFGLYDSLTAWPLDLARVRYHRVSKCVRSLMAIVSMAERGQPTERRTWVGYRALYGRAFCQALAEAGGFSLGLLRRQPGGRGPDRGPPDGSDLRSRLESVLGRPIASERQGLEYLDSALRDGHIGCDDLEVLRFLTARADDQCRRHRSAMGAMADRVFSTID